MNKLEKLYKSLLKEHGMPGDLWTKWCKEKKTKKDREEIAVGAILTQGTTWHNVCLALTNLKKAKNTSFHKIDDSNIKEIEEVIRPSGFYEQKIR